MELHAAVFSGLVVSIFHSLHQHRTAIGDGYVRICGRTDADSLIRNIRSDELASRLDRENGLPGTVAEERAIPHSEAAAVFHRQCRRLRSFAGAIVSDIEISRDLLWFPDRFAIRVHIVGKHLNCRQHAQHASCEQFHGHFSFTLF